MNGKKQKRWVKGLKQSIEAYLYILPAASVLLVFWFVPVIMSIFVSLTDWEALDTVKTVNFVGFRNYALLLQDENFFKSLFNTVNYVIYSVPTTMLIALIIAMLLNRKLVGLGIFRTVYFLPFITTWVAISIVWKYVYNTHFGLANHILVNWVGQAPLSWLDEPRGIFAMLLSPLGISPSHPLLAGPSLAMTSIIITSVWRDIGFFMVIFLAGLQTIDRTYYEAAEIDGANWWQKFLHITWPLLSPVTFFLLVISMINAFKVFIPILIMTPQGGPDNTTISMVFYLYEQGFRGLWLLGYAAAIAYMLFIIILFLTFLQNVVLGRRVHYESY